MKDIIDKAVKGGLMKFQVGKYYKHSGNGMMHVISGALTTMWGWCLIAEETKSSHLRPIGQDEESTQNWTESTEEEWMKNFNI